MNKEQLAKRIYEVSHLTGEFKLRSGMISNEYFDKYRFESQPEILAEIAVAMAELLPEGTEMLAGLETGGIPLATAISLNTGIPALFVRKKAKEYGTCNMAEGGEFAGKKIAVIEDVITTGGQVVMSTTELRDMGADIVGVIAVIDRQSGGPENIAKAGFKLTALYTKEELDKASKA
jgi:orotate phosphoribosyltransferase